jgi:hypothetical protein
MRRFSGLRSLKESPNSWMESRAADTSPITNLTSGDDRATEKKGPGARIIETAMFEDLNKIKTQ